MSVWDDLKKRLVVQFVSEGEVRTSSLKDLDRYEKDNSFRLPDDYREFAGTFGPGTYGRGWEIKAPGFGGAKRGRLDLAKLSQGLKGVYPGFVAFCGKEDFQGWFAWNPDDVTEPARHDYGVYLLGGPAGEDSRAEPIRVAPTFHEFVMSFALGQGFERQGFGDGSYAYDEARARGPVPFSQVI